MHVEKLTFRIKHKYFHEGSSTFLRSKFNLLHATYIYIKLFEQKRQASQFTPQRNRKLLSSGWYFLF